MERCDLGATDQVSTVGLIHVDLNEVAAVIVRHLSVFFPAIFVACNSSLTDTIENIEQRYLFEVEYVNFAWGLQWNGLVIDREGNIYGYDHNHEIWDLVGNESFTETELEDKYEHDSRYIGRIDEATIVLQFSRISRVGDNFSTAQHLCADAGGITYRAFRYESATGLYHPLVLREEGDFARQNTTDAAEELSEWLRSLMMTLENSSVTPFSQGVCTP